MQTQLVPGANASLQDPHVRIDVSWSVGNGRGGEVGLCVFFLNAAGMMRGDHDVLTSQNLAHPISAARFAYSGQTRRNIELRTDQVDDAIEKIVLVLTIPKASPLHIGYLQHIRLTADSTPLLIHFDTSDPTSADQSMTLAELYRYRGLWRLRAVGESIPDTPDTSPPRPWISQAKALGFIA